MDELSAGELSLGELSGHGFKQLGSLSPVIVRGGFLSWNHSLYIFLFYVNTKLVMRIFIIPKLNMDASVCNQAIIAPTQKLGLYQRPERATISRLLCIQ